MLVVEVEVQTETALMARGILVETVVMVLLTVAWVVFFPCPPLGLILEELATLVVAVVVVVPTVEQVAKVEVETEILAPTEWLIQEAAEGELAQQPKHQEMVVLVSSSLPIPQPTLTDSPLPEHSTLTTSPTRVAERLG